VNVLDELKTIVGSGNWTDDARELEPHLREWRDIWVGRTPLMVSPDSTEKVAAVVRACNESRTAIVPQGGNTGLCGGAIPDNSGEQILLSLSKMNRIRSISPNDHSISVDAGCTLANIQSVASDADRFFPLSLAAEGSCQIGGNLSTNAGGINVLRYGTARSLALGLEVVLPDGSIWNGLRSLRKDTSGYDLKQFFIGAEGTLGVITGANLRLFPTIKNSQTALIAINSPSVAVEMYATLRENLGDQVQAFELIPHLAMTFVQEHIPSCSIPGIEPSDWYVLMESSDLGNDEMLLRELSRQIESGLATDVVLAKNRSESASLWRIRHSISEAQKREGASLKHDVAVPVGSVGSFIRQATAAVEEFLPGIRPVPFGHIGDGNIHFNLSQPKEWQPGTFDQQREALASVVYDIVVDHDGTISAEHGIGQAKKAHLLHYRGDLEVGLMRAIKNTLDPNNIMNPGKLF
jgi:FAD/FMN-containing dehydrogenase